MHAALVHPMTEALYLLDDAMLDAVKAWARGRERAVRDLDRWAEGKRTGRSPTKGDLTRLVNGSRHKTELAQRVAAVVAGDTWTAPKVPCLAPLVSWLDATFP